MAYGGDRDFQRHKTAFGLAVGAMAFGPLIATSSSISDLSGVLRIIAGLLLIGGGAYGLMRYWRSV
jgi:hypothetical protein